jgi:isoleucyl-tRNA synthetase
VSLLTFTCYKAGRQQGSPPCCRACQTVLAALAARLLPALAPVLPHMAEDAWQHLPWPQPAASVFQVGAPAAAGHVQ